MIRLVRMSNLEMRSHLRDSYSCKNQAALRMREYALAKTAGKSVIAFVIGWSPYACLALISLSGKVSKLKPIPYFSLKSLKITNKSYYL